MIGAKRHKVMAHNVDLTSPRIKKELLRQVKLSSNDSYIDEAVGHILSCCTEYCIWPNLVKKNLEWP